MEAYSLINTFPDFLTFWSAAREKPVETQIKSWAGDYLASWPELLVKQQEDYASDGQDWREIARLKVFPFLGERLPAMHEAQGHLLVLCPEVWTKARLTLDFDCPLIFVIYVGIGCGAGWVTIYEGQPAILFGLESIAESGWSQPAALEGLVAHEIGHVVHFHWREEAGRPKGEGSFWQLYMEGFAQRCEQQLLGRESWHMRRSKQDGDWLRWCHDHRSWLAAEFLRCVDQGESVRPFFGSWFEIRGRKQTGYYLGCEAINALVGQHSLKQVALLEDFEAALRSQLEHMAAAPLGSE